MVDLQLITVVAVIYANYYFLGNFENIINNGIIREGLKKTYDSSPIKNNDLKWDNISIEFLFYS